LSLSYSSHITDNVDPVSRADELTLMSLEWRALWDDTAQ
jgi:hypothetical protein